jgi:ABC-type lipoprotein release transport system permease subunit
VAGLTAGLGVAMAAAPMLRAYLVGIGPYDAPAFVAVIVVLALAACAATVVPVRRATRVDPAVTLRQE